MIPITSPWPFCKWTIDIVGPFPAGSESADYLVVAIDFFTKWVEAKPLSKIMSNKVTDFFWDSIVCSTGETPFSLVYGLEAVLPVAIAIPTEKMMSFNQNQNSRDMRTNLELLQERREMTAAREAINKQRIARYYDKRVRLITYTVGDLVWRDNQASRIEDTRKLGPNWEAPTGSLELLKLEPTNWRSSMVR
ncbi:uncharacterized protein [Rutidosis leptorrhynchoides]|uniref:uncharacterized protein n=1 Tax=Rutidosis leptorrhynchoides TaxID=125765 RepID=UPI003A998E4B